MKDLKRRALTRTSHGGSALRLHDDTNVPADTPSEDVLWNYTPWNSMKDLQRRALVLSRSPQGHPTHPENFHFKG